MSLLTVLMALSGTAFGANANVGPNDSIVNVINGLPGGGPHVITILSGGRYIESQRLDVGSRDIEIIGTGYTTTTWMYDGPLQEMITIGSGGSLILRDITLDGSVPPTIVEDCDNGLDDDLDLLVDCEDPDCDRACGFADEDLCAFADDRTGVVAANASNVELEGVQLRCFFTFGNGGGLRATNTPVTITDSYFWENVAVFDGGHVYIRDGGPFISTGSEYLYGLASLGSGGAIYSIESPVTIDDNYFRNNESSVRGGAVFASSNTDNINLWHNTMQQNVSLLITRFSLIDQDIVAVDTADRFVDFSTFSIFTGEGGGAYVDGQTNDIWDNLMCGNLADKGGGLAMDDVPDANIRNNIFNENYSLHYGGGAYIGAGPLTSEPVILNNTFLGNSAGKNPPGFIPTVYVIGAGGAMMLDGTLSDFRNNIVSHTTFGGGICGLDGDNYTLGDPITMDYNIFYWNCEVDGCGDADPLEWLHLTGDYATHTLSPLNFEFDPYPSYYGGPDLDCYPDAFYTTFDSPAIDNGDPSIVDVGGSISDIGAYGGPDANALDQDGDGIENMYDCNDQDINTGPNQNEQCDFLDNNCNGEVDEGFDNEWWFDLDGDGFGDATHFVPDLITCVNQSNMVANNDDCNDGDAAINPDAIEVCDDQDNDCNDIIDDEELLPRSLFYRDDDNDTYGADNAVRTECTAPPGYVAVSGDCDDADSSVNPGAVETCTGTDQNCDGEVDNDATGASLWSQDKDGDGWGTAETAINTCDPPGADYVENRPGVGQDGDCDDDLENSLVAFQVNPDAAEACDEIDNNCDGEIDNVLPPLGKEYSLDADGDGFGDPATITRDCEQPAGYILHEADDCDDENDLVGECSECGCQTTTPNVPYALLLLIGGLLTIRRSRE